MKALLIDVATGTVREVEYAGLADMHKLLGGYIEPVAQAGIAVVDTLYVDETGTLKVKDGFFKIMGRNQPMAGNGLVVGAEVEDDSAAGYSNRDPVTTVEELTAMVRFQTRGQVDSWGKANASEPAVTFTTFGGPEGSKTEVMQRFGFVIENMPRKED